MATKSHPAPGSGARRDRTLQEYQHDTYKLRGKLKEPTVCIECQAVFHKGRWTWEAKPEGAYEITCPACLRIRDKYPKGFLTLKGSFAEEQHEQVMGVVHNVETKEKQEHPLSRLMNVERRPEGLVVSTTDTHLPRRIGEALKHAYHGELDLHYDDDEDFIRVIWTR
jgi:NMD protein affecting ribosome stability and mRNA decay